MSDGRKELSGCGLTWLVACALLALMAWLLCGCKAHEVIVEKPVVVEHTTERHKVDIVRDTLVMRDSVYHWVKGDTVLIERWHHVAEVSKMTVADTVRDTVPRVVTRVETRQVNRLHPWQRMLMWLGAGAIIMIVLCVVLRVRKMKI